MVLVEGASSANASASILCRFNGDTGSNYYYTGARIEGLAAYSTGVVGNDYGSTTAAIFGVMGTILPQPEQHMWGSMERMCAVIAGLSIGSAAALAQKFLKFPVFGFRVA